MHHVAIMQKSWGMIQQIAYGQKTIESRWYLNRSAPWDKIKTGDTVYFKNSGEPVGLQATVAKVLQFDQLTPEKVRSLLNEYGGRIGIAPEDISRYYEQFKNKRYCLLIFLEDVQKIKPFNINKAGYGAMAAWITAPSIDVIKQRINNSVHLQALKPNGTPHQSWYSRLIAQSGDWIITHATYETAVRHHTKDLTYVMQHSNLGIFNTKEYFNAFIDFNKDGTFKMLYINVATPAILGNNEIIWTDLELDIVRLPGKPAELVDEDEFEEAKTNGLLSINLANKSREVATALMEVVNDGEFPFLAENYDKVIAAIAQHLGIVSDAFPRLEDE